MALELTDTDDAPYAIEVFKGARGEIGPVGPVGAVGPTGPKGDGISVADMDVRYGPLNPPAHVVSTSGGSQTVPAPSVTVGNVHQYGLDQSACAITLPSGMTDVAGKPSQADIVMYLVNNGGGTRNFSITNTSSWDGAGKPTIPSAANSTTIVTATTMDGGASYFLSGNVATASTPPVPIATVTAKGDLIVGSGSAAVTRLGAPGASKMLTSDANNNLGWSDIPAAGSGGSASTYSVTWQPSDNNMVAANTIPSSLASVNNMTAGKDYVAKIKVKSGTVVTGFVTFLSTVVTNPVGFYAALYDASGNLLVQTADVSNAFKVAAVTANFSSTYTATSDGYLYLVIHNGTADTQGKFIGPPAATIMNFGLSGTAAGNTAPRISTCANTWSGSSAPASLGNLTGAGATSFFGGLV